MTSIQKQLHRPPSQTSTVSPSRQLPLSRTCRSCINAKVKCNRKDDAIICERCRRLSKDCVFAQARRQNNGTRKDVRIEALEAKVDQLLDQAAASTLTFTSTETSSCKDSSERAAFTTPMVSQISNVPLHFGNGSVTGASAHTSDTDVIATGLLTMEVASSLLHTFRTVMTPHFPFAYIQPQQYAEEVRQQRPFLFLAILAAASYDNMPLQKALGKEVKQTISTRMVINGEMSLDLLQELLIHLAWCQYHSRPRRYTQLLQLAIGIIVDLQLDRPPQARSWKTGVTFNSENSTEISTKLLRSREEQRAIAGCFYLSSSISILLHKLSTFPYSAYIEGCCESLSTEEECPSDKYLLPIVRLQHILEKINRLSVRHGLEPSYPDSALELHVMTFKSDLELFKERLPFAINESNLLVMQFHTVEMFLYQISLLDRYNESDKGITRPNSWSPWRLETLCAGLLTSKLFLDSYLSHPLREEMAFNNTEWVQLGFALIVATKFPVAGTAKFISRETMNPRRSLDISSMLQRCVLRTRALISPHLDDDGERDVFYHYEKRARALQCWFEKQSLEQPVLPPFGNNQASENTSLAIGQYPKTHITGNDALDDFTDFSGFDKDRLADEAYDSNIPNRFTEDTLDGIMGDWMSYPMFPVS